MLEIKNITKKYDTSGFSQKALDNISICFRKSEFVSILGPSGSGKTTLLNIIGGLDHYTSGDLIINGVSTKKYKDSDWDSYRNHRVGFVFQSYNLISHQSILNNVMLALTLSGISKKEAVERSKAALKSVGLEDHINKRPNQLSGGQMQRVAIARALVNDPDILLADEPTGALDSETSVQIMELLKSISKNKLVIMVTHNPELAEKYSSRIISLKDGVVISDSNLQKTVNKGNKVYSKVKKTNMSFLTALNLSFNNLMTKKARTVLVSFAGSIGIIGIALILAVSTGFNNYINSIQEDTLTSYPLTIMKESADITSMLLSMTTGSKDNDKSGTVKEQQYISTMLSNVKSNDLKSFKKYIENNKKEINNDISTIKYSYSVDPLIYSYDATGKLARLNPSSLFTSIYSSNMMSSYSSFASIFSQMMDNKDIIKQQYDILEGRLPEKYDEMMIVLSEPNTISDLLVYSLGLRDSDELTSMVNGIMSGKTVNVNNKPLTFTYQDLLNVKLKLVMPSDMYKYNSKYDVYEDMSEDETYLKNLYNKSMDLKIVGIVSAKEGMTSMALNPGVVYTSDLVKHIIDYSSKTDIVKKQLLKEDVDVFSGKRFDSKKNNFDFKFEDLVSIDSKKLESAFNVKIDRTKLEKQTKNYMNEISNAITTDTKPANEAFMNTLNNLANQMFSKIDDKISLQESTTFVDNFLDTYDAGNLMSNLEKKYVVPKYVFKNTYSSLLKGLLQIYISSYSALDPSYTTDTSNPVAVVNQDVVTSVKGSYLGSAAIVGVADTMAKSMTEALAKKTVLTKVGELTSNITNTFASSFNVDKDKISSAFKLNFSEQELSRVVSSMFNTKETNANTNLISLGYQDLENPTSISLYFNSFDGKKHFLNFIDSYNKKMEKSKQDDKVINYSDTTGILMSSIKTIVNAVSYVLIAFVSISLVVSSIMIGVITYISVFERTKEIGILRSIGASKRNISSIFNAETIIVGFLSGLFGIGITYLLIPIINKVLHHFTGNIPLSAVLNIKYGLLLVGLSIILTLIGGLIPAKSASKKDPVEALRSE